MLALRRLARAAPVRLSTRLAPRTALTPIASRISAPSSITRLAGASFSTTRARLDEHSQYLAARLAKEIELEAEETAAGSGSEAGVKQFLEENPVWSIVDVEGEQDVLLQRTYEDEEVTVHFNIADFNQALHGEEGLGLEEDVMGDEEDLETQSGGANTKGSSVQGRTSGGNYKVAPEDSEEGASSEAYDEDDSTPAFPVNVTVLIRRPSAPEKGSLRFELVADNGDFAIQQVTPLPASDATPLELVRESYSDRQTRYAGPPFEQLDEAVQETLEEYLAARGVNSSLAAVVPDYVDVKEQREYLAWLGRVRSFVE